MISVRAFFRKSSYSRAISGDTTSIMSRFSSQNSMTWKNGLCPRMPRPKVLARQPSRVPIASIRQVVVFGNVQVSTQALECLASLEVPVSYLTPYGRFVAALMPAPAKNMSLRVGQYRAFDRSNDYGQDLAQYYPEATRPMLQRYHAESADRIRTICV